MQDSNKPTTEPVVYALDYETHYTKDYSLKVLPVRAYVYHPDFNAYMLSVASSDGLVWVGNPKDFDWGLIENNVVLHHNAQFDALVTQRLQELGTIPAVKPAAIHDTADLAAYLQHPRALKDHAKFVWGLKDIAEKGKAARDKMAYTASEDLAKDEEILEYATMDAKLCLRLWQEFSSEWPIEERELSRLNRETCFRGVAVDVDYIEEVCNRMAHRLFDAERVIPWDWTGRKTPLSRNKIIEHCKEVGIWYPASFAQGDEDCMRWEDKFSKKYPWVKAIRDWRRINILYGKVKHLRDNHDNGIYYPQFKYFGARTGRFSGDGKFNLQNLPRAEMFCDTDENGKDIPSTGCDLRKCFIARPGHKLAQIDYAQIEARTLVAVVNDEPVLEKIREGMSIYEAHARATMGWTGGELKKENKELYQLAKARCVSGDTLVLTNRGYVPIFEVALDDMVWDGLSFVHHGGVIVSGTKQTLSFKGDNYTNEHKIFYSETETINAGAILTREQTAAVSRYRCTCSSRDEIRELALALYRVSAGLGPKAFSVFVLRMRRLWESAMGSLGQLVYGKDKVLYQMCKPKDKGQKESGKVGEDS
jgi:hypothetical protein